MFYCGSGVLQMQGRKRNRAFVVVVGVLEGEERGVDGGEDISVQGDVGRGAGARIDGRLGDGTGDTGGDSKKQGWLIVEFFLFFGCRD